LFSTFNYVASRCRKSLWEVEGITDQQSAIQNNAVVGILSQTPKTAELYILCN
jgi:hypothetical protein